MSLKLAAPGTGRVDMWLGDGDVEGSWYLLQVSGENWRDEDLHDGDWYEITIRSSDGQPFLSVRKKAEYEPSEWATLRRGLPQVCYRTSLLSMRACRRATPCLGSSIRRRAERGTRVRPH